MNFIKCKKGHFYDPDVTSSCPECAEGTAQTNLETAPIGNNGVENYSETVAVGRTGGNDANFHEAEMSTKPLSQNYKTTGGAVEDYDGITEPIYVNDIPGFSPVVGWLVCIDGVEKGKDYRIMHGYNYIGRGDNMYISIKGDKKISREMNAVIAYDDKEKVFFCGPLQGQNLVRINDKLIINQKILNSHDIITIGTTKLIFIPFCGDLFDWQSYGVTE